MHKSIVIQNHILNKVVPDNGKLRNIYQKSKRVFIMTAKWNNIDIWSTKQNIQHAFFFTQLIIINI